MSGQNSDEASQLTDSNGNDVLKLVATASAVDYIKVTNGAAGNPGLPHSPARSEEA